MMALDILKLITVLVIFLKRNYPTSTFLGINHIDEDHITVMVEHPCHPADGNPYNTAIKISHKQLEEYK